MTAYASAARVDGLFDHARAAVPIEDLLTREGFKLICAGREARTSCPMCGAGQRSRSAFAVKGDKWRCYGGCDKAGDVVDLEQFFRGGSALDAAKRLVGGDIPSSLAARPARERARSARGEGQEKVAREIWAGAKPFADSLAKRYLMGRGISPAVLELAAANLRFHPFAKHHWDDRAGDWVKAPALVVQVVTPAGPTGGVHCTYLDRITARKAALDPAKRMWGPQLDADGRPGVAWLVGPAGDGDLVTGEGIETSLSVVTLGARAGLTYRACAALSLGRLQGGIARDDDGCFDPLDPQPDPGSPAATWPNPADDPWGEVLVAVDHDMGEIRVKARTGRGKPCHFRLTREMRARICGRLAVAAWKTAGAPTARAIAPSPGLDFNDELRRVLAREGCA